MSRARDFADLAGSADAGGITGRNLIINGAMQVAQRGTSVTGLGGSGAYGAVDRFRIGAGSTNGRLTASQVAVTDLPGFTTALKLECTTADTSIAAGENLIIQQKLEGKDVQHLKKGTSSAEPITISFYVKGNAAATYTCEAKDQDNTRYNNQEFSVTTSWNRISLTFVGDTTGSFTNDNNASFELGLWLHAGSTFTSGTFASNTWHTDNGKRVGDNQTSFYDSTSRTFFLTGVQMEVGEQATPFEHRSFGDELRRCQRYYQIIDDAIWTGDVTTGNDYYYNTPRPVEMRAAATQTYSGVASSRFDTSSIANGTNNKTVVSVFCRSNATGSRGYYAFDIQSDAEL